MGSVALSASWKKGQNKLEPGTWQTCTAHLQGRHLYLSVLYPFYLAARHVFPEKSRADLSAWQRWRQMEIGGDGLLPSCPHRCCPPRPTWTVEFTWSRLPALQTWDTFGLAAETVLHMCYGHWHCHLTTSVLKINPIPFQRKQSPSFELLMST